MEDRGGLVRSEAVFFFFFFFWLCRQRWRGGSWRDLDLGVVVRLVEGFFFCMCVRLSGWGG